MSHVKRFPDAMVKDEEAGCGTEAPRESISEPLPRRLRVVQDNPKGVAKPAISVKSLRVLARTNLIMAGIIFFSTVVVAACLCRPVVVMGGVWVGVLVLVQAVLGLRTHSSHALLVGHAWVSGAVCLVCVTAAAYLFSGHLKLACVSAFHRPDHASLVRLYVVEVVGLVACLPCLAVAVICLLATALSARAACPPKTKKNEAPFVLYLSRWDGEGSYGTTSTTSMPQLGAAAALPSTPLPNNPHNNQQQQFSASAIPQDSSSEKGQRENSPPPSYNQIEEESYA